MSFDDRHSYARMQDAAVRAVKDRVQLVPDVSLMNPAASRSGHVEVTLRDGRAFEHFTQHAPGTKENPMDTAGVNEKARRLIEPALGAGPTAALLQRVNALEDVRDVRELMPLLAMPARA